MWHWFRGRCHVICNLNLSAKSAINQHSGANHRSQAARLGQGLWLGSLNISNKEGSACACLVRFSTLLVIHLVHLPIYPSLFHWHWNNLLTWYSLSGQTSYRKISWSLEAARFGFRLSQSLCHLAGTSAAALPRRLSNFRAVRSW